MNLYVGVFESYRLTKTQSKYACTTCSHTKSNRWLKGFNEGRIEYVWDRDSRLIQCSSGPHESSPQAGPRSIQPCLHSEGKRKGRTLDIAALNEGTSLQRRSIMARVVEGFHSFTWTSTRLSTNGMNRTCRVTYRLTDARDHRSQWSAPRALDAAQ